MQYDPSPITIKMFKWSIRTWWDDLTGLAMMNLIFMFSWFTVILGPPVTFGLYYLSHELVRGQSLGLSGLIEGARKYFWRSWVWAIANLAVIILLWTNIVFYGNSDLVWVRGLPIVMILLGLVWFVVQYYTVPFLMLQDEKSLKIAWRNAYLIAALYPGFTLVMVAFSLVVLVASFAFMLPLFLGAVPLVTILGCQAVKNRVEEYNLRFKDNPGAKKEE